MVRVRMPVRRGVTVGRAIAASDVAAGHAQPQVIPLSATAPAFFAALTRGSEVVDQVEMAAGGCHGPAPFGRLVGDAAATMGNFQPDPPGAPEAIAMLAAVSSWSRVVVGRGRVTPG
jgi:hypothetical protein